MKDKQTQWEKLPGSFNRKLCDESILAIFPPMNSSGLFSAFHFKDGGTKIGEFTSMKLAQDAADQYARKNKLTGAPIPDVDAFFAARAVYAAALDKASHIKDASLISAVQLAQAEFVRTMGSKPVGQMHIPVKKAIQSDANKPPIPAPTLPVIPIQKRQPALLHNTPKP